MFKILGTCSWWRWRDRIGWPRWIGSRLASDDQPSHGFPNGGDIHGLGWRCTSMIPRRFGWFARMQALDRGMDAAMSTESSV